MSATQNSATPLPKGPNETGAAPPFVIKRVVGSARADGLLALILLIAALSTGSHLIVVACASVILWVVQSFRMRKTGGVPLAILDENGVWVNLPRYFRGTMPWRCIRACALRETRSRKTLRIFLYPGAYEGIVPGPFWKLMHDYFDIEMANADAAQILAACAAWIAAARASRPEDPVLDRIDAQESDPAVDDFVANRLRWPVRAVDVVVIILILLAMLSVVALGHFLADFLGRWWPKL